MKKIFALTTAVLMILGIFCSCTPKTQDKSSSQIANTDTSIPSIESNDKNTSSAKTESNKEPSIPLPSEEILKELFDKSALYLSRCFYDERSNWVSKDLEGIEFDIMTYYRTDGSVAAIGDGGEGPLYWMTNYKYSDAKKFYGQTLSGPLLYKFMAYNFYDINGVLAIRGGGGASGFSYEDLEFTYVKYDLYYPYTFYYYTASYYLTRENRTEVVDFVVRKSEDGYTVCVNDFFSGVRGGGWDLDMYIEP